MLRIFAAVVAASVTLGGCSDAGGNGRGNDPATAAAAAGGEAPEAAPQAASEADPQEPQRHILAFGDSLFAGYGLPRHAAYPARLESALRARGINARVINAGVSGDTTAGGLQRLEFVLDSLDTPPDLALVELGANDMLRALPPQQARANLDAILTRLSERGIPVVLMGMLAMPNLGREYVAEFNAIYPALACEHDAELVPFFIRPLIEDRSLVQEDQVHPTAAGVDAMVAQTVEAVAAAVPPADARGPG